MKDHVIRFFNERSFEKSNKFKIEGYSIIFEQGKRPEINLYLGMKDPKDGEIDEKTIKRFNYRHSTNFKLYEDNYKICLKFNKKENKKSGRGTIEEILK